MQFASAFIVLLICFKVNCYNILAVFLYDGESHFKVSIPLLKELTKRGHKVTMLGYFPIKDQLSGYTEVLFENPKLCVDFTYYTKFNSRLAKYMTPHLVRSGTEKRCEAIISSEKFRNVLENVEQYDVILTEFFDTNCFLYPILAKKAKPVVGIQTNTLLPWTNEWVGNPHHPAYVPLVFLDHSDRMNFWQRLENTALWIYSYAYHTYVIRREDYNLFKKHFGEGGSISQDFVFNTSLVLVNSHVSLHGARPFVPNVLEVAGMHLEKHQKLPEHIEKWLDESEQGVIYFSFGSLLKGALPDGIRQMFTRAFRRFPQRVLWKWELDEQPEPSSNIMFEKWMPQFDILCHPKTRAFIAHGGLLGVIEAVHCGVPLVVLPRFGDQFVNAKAVEATGGGVVLDYNSLDEESIYKALAAVLHPSFAKKSKELSIRFKDRPMSPLETAVYWFEYVVRYGGAPQLRTAAAGMPLYQYLLLDVALFIITALFLISFTFYFAIKIALSKIFNFKKKIRTD